MDSFCEQGNELSEMKNGTSNFSTKWANVKSWKKPLGSEFKQF
jgi:hypothetical protein